jgi:hypothetical protein
VAVFYPLGYPTPYGPGLYSDAARDVGDPFGEGGIFRITQSYLFCLIKLCLLGYRNPRGLITSVFCQAPISSGWSIYSPFILGFLVYAVLAAGRP